MLSEKEMRLIAYLKSVGYGYAKFAASVEASGKCSEKQLATMENMLQKIKGTSSVHSEQVARVSKTTNRNSRGDNYVSRLYTEDGGCYTDFGGPCGPLYIDKFGNMQIFSASIADIWGVEYVW